jgi:AcrR family transcriptional regulator
MKGQEKNNGPGQGRVSQKNRTRAALVAAASEMVKMGKQPTVSDAAEAADISRATAYRYFPAQEMLLAEVALFAVGGPLFSDTDENVLLPEAIGRLVRRVGNWAFANEQPLRTLLRLSLDPSSGVHRPGHRREWIADALAGGRERMDAQTFKRLSRALTLLMGIDPVVVMKDIAGASREEALDAMEWSARALVSAALGSATAPGRAKKTLVGRPGKRRSD